MEQPLVQILVVVANTQVRNLRTEVDQGFIWTVFGYELVGPKIIEKSCCIDLILGLDRKRRAQNTIKYYQKGIRLIFLNLGCDNYVEEPGSNWADRRNANGDIKWTLIF